MSIYWSAEWLLLMVIIMVQYFLCVYFADNSQFSERRVGHLVLLNGKLKGCKRNQFQDNFHQRPTRIPVGHLDMVVS